jgi:hypothetical protein
VITPAAHAWARAVAAALADSGLVVGPGSNIGRATARHGSFSSANHTEVVHLRTSRMYVLAGA